MMRARTGFGRWTVDVVGTLGVAAVLTGCGGTAEPEPPAHVTSAPDGVDVELGVGEAVVVDDVGVRIVFLDVPSDSRCPVDVTCVWEGDAAARLETTAEGAGTDTLILHTALEPREVVTAGLRLRLLSVLPEPRSDAPIPPERYRVHLRIEPL